MNYTILFGISHSLTSKSVWWKNRKRKGDEVPLYIWKETMKLKRIKEAEPPAHIHIMQDKDKE
jgi:hypothetical protein